MMETLGFANGMALARAASPLLALFAAAAAILAFGAVAGKARPRLAVAVALAGLVAAGLLAWRLWPEASGAKIELFFFDRLTFVAWLVLFAAAAAALLLVARPTGGNLPRGAAPALMLLATCGLGLIVAGADLVVVLLGLEIASLSLTALVASSRKQALALEGAIKWFLPGAVATAFFLMGIAFLFGSAGTTDLGLLALRAREVMGGEGRELWLFGCAMVTVGFAFRIAAVPFHAWAPDACEGAPVAVASFLATAVQAAAVVAFARFALAAAAHGGTAWHHLVSGIAIVTMVWGGLAAIRQEHLQRLLAYVSIAQGGALLVLFPSIGADAPLALRAVLLTALALTLATAGACAAISAMEGERGGRVELAHLAGLASRRPGISAVLSLCLLSLAGIPPTVGFLAKGVLFLTAMRNGDALLAAGGLLASVLLAFACLRPVVAMTFHRQRAEAPFADRAGASPAAVAVMALAAMGIVAFGLFPESLVALVQNSIR